MTTMRVGHGFDVHRFGESTAESVEITLGGVKIPATRPLLAHSDGDVMLHAVCDALLGAVGLGDIGEHFPDTDSQYRNADSRKLLQQVVEKIASREWRLANLDITLVAQTPKVLPYKQRMIKCLAQDLCCHAEQINIKATTTEGLGYTGRSEGIACHAVVLLVRA